MVRWLACCLAWFALAATVQAGKVAPAAAAAKSTAAETGIAAVYSDKLQGRKTASGEPYDRALLTAAHKTLPFGTRVKVTHKHNTVTVRINDRGPFTAGRIVDLSAAAARALGIDPRGIGQVTLEVVGEARRGGK
jgi:rare lipoprotein A